MKISKTPDIERISQETKENRGITATSEEFAAWAFRKHGNTIADQVSVDEVFRHYVIERSLRMNDKKDDLEGFFYRFGEWLSETPLGGILARFPGLSLFAILILLQSAYWATAWWSPVPFLVFTCIGFVLMTYLGKGPLTIYSLNLRQAATTDIGAKMIVIGLPFVLAQAAAFFACLYMLGEVKTSDGLLVSGAWEHFYFSVVTLTTLGYGNLVPSDGWAELVAVVESLFGFMVFAIYAGALATIALRRSVGSDEFEDRLIDQGGVVLTNEQVRQLNIDQEIGVKYFIRFIYVTIYGSQYRLLQALSSKESLSLKSIKYEHYAEYVAQLSDSTQPSSFNEWLAYLVDNMLVRVNVEESSCEITRYGFLFVGEVKNTGAKDDFPY